VGIDAGAATSRTRLGRLPVGLANSSSKARFCSRIFLPRARADEARAGWIRRRAHADNERASARVCIDDARARSRTPLVVQYLEPFAVIQGAQRIGGHAFEAPDVFFAAVGERRVFEWNGQPLGAQVVFAGFGFQRGA